MSQMNGQQCHRITTNEIRWKTNVEQKLRMLEESINRMTRQGLPTEPQSGLSTQARAETGPSYTPAGGMSTESTSRNEQAWEVVMDLNKGPAVVPASCVCELSVPFPIPPRQDVADDNDLIDSGIIGLEDADAFFSLYRSRLDHFLYGILSEHDSLGSVRKSSSLLTAAICAVGALHAPSRLYQACYQHFVSLASSRMFSKRNSHDDVRALCIGAFWLNDISWTLVGTGASPFLPLCFEKTSKSLVLTEGGASFLVFVLCCRRLLRLTLVTQRSASQVN